MKSHPKQLGVQMAATACLYNLSKGEVGAKVHPACLTQIVNLTLLAMENFPNHQQVRPPSPTGCHHVSIRFHLNHGENPPQNVVS